METKLINKRNEIIRRIRAQAWSQGKEPAYEKLVVINALQKELHQLNQKLGM